MNKTLLFSMVAAAVLLSACSEEHKSEPQATPSATQAEHNATEVNKTTQQEAKEAIKKAAVATEKLAVEKASEIKKMALEMDAKMAKEAQENNISKTKLYMNKALDATKDVAQSTKEKLGVATKEINTTKMMNDVKNMSKGLMDGAAAMMKGNESNSSH